jgi:GNAT superfamily N-acetyltransferase
MTYTSAMPAAGSAKRRRPSAVPKVQSSRSLKKVPWDDVWGYGCRFEAKRQLLISSGDPDEYVLDIGGEILWSDPDQSDSWGYAPIVVGEMTAHLIQAGRAVNDGVSLAEVCDCHSQELSDVFGAIYDVDSDGLKDSVSDGCSGLDVLVLSRVLVLPEHRGRRLGQLAMLRAIEDYGTGAGAAVCKPFPIQSEPQRQVAEDMYKLDDFGKDHERGMLRLRRYWGELGFAQVEHSEWYALDLTYRRPGFKDLVGGP